MQLLKDNYAPSRTDSDHCRGGGPQALETSQGGRTRPATAGAPADGQRLRADILEAREGLGRYKSMLAAAAVANSASNAGIDQKWHDKLQKLEKSCDRIDYNLTKTHRKLVQRGFFVEEYDEVDDGERILALDDLLGEKKEKKKKRRRRKKKSEQKSTGWMSFMIGVGLTILTGGLVVSLASDGAISINVPV
ncbi:hypothetical protein PG994_007683 [Apiospora phragmitis]|uniref:Uncharacterized protein n=1 Tax=Apiospora phragmitis TaxID=2905665 RepID=A0ABR1UQZ0_9PEZI